MSPLRKPTRIVSTAALAAIVLVSSAAGEPRFIEIGDGLGLDHIYAGGWEHFVGGGVAAFDCNNDGFPEIYAAGGEKPAQLFLNQATRSPATIRLIPAPHSETAITGVTGAYPLDIDSDGRLDLAVLRVGENVLLRGLGDCRFEPANTAWGFDGGNAWTTAFSATWRTGRDWPVLAFGNYVNREDPGGPFEACDANILVNPADKIAGFAPPEPLEPGYCALSMLFSDWGRSGRADLRISNDRHYYVRNGEEQLWRFDGTPRLYGPDDGWQRLSIWGMGIASRDLDGDGRPEVMLTSMGDQKLRRLADNDGRPVYQDHAFAAGVTAHRPYTGDDGRPSTGWHAEFGDVDNDGYDDLFIAKGNVQSMGDVAMFDPNNLLLGSPDGRFHEAGARAGVDSVRRARGAALVDLDLDGRLDIVVANRNEPLEVFWNRTETKDRWIQLRLRQPGANRDAVGAWVSVRSATRVWHREVSVGGGHAGGQLGWLHFGLGEADAAELQVTWPGGEPSDWIPLAANRFYSLVRGERPRPWTP